MKIDSNLWLLKLTKLEKVSDISGLGGSSAQTTAAAASVNKRKLYWNTSLSPTYRLASRKFHALLYVLYTMKLKAV